MDFLFLSVTAVVTVFAFRFWRAFFAARVGSEGRIIEWDTGPGSVAHLPGLLMNQSDRRAWNSMVFTVVIFLLGLPHWLVIRSFGLGRETLQWLLVSYGLTLVYWVGLVAAYAFFFVRVREGERRQRDQQSK